jgi:hypothetical protein
MPNIYLLKMLLLKMLLKNNKEIWNLVVRIDNFQ